jgi:putative intracellular protease/amidase
MAGIGEKIKQTVQQGLHLGGKPLEGKRVLIVATSHDKLGNSDLPTGSWAEELSAPYYVFKEAGADVVVASIKGGKIPMDEASLSENFITPHVKKYMEDEELKQYVDNSLSLNDVPGSFDALFVPGGHGIVFDGPNDKNLNALGEKFWAEGKIVSAVCHGPAGLVNMKTPDGFSIFKGRKCTGFTNAEEEAVKKTEYVPFLLEDKMKEIGGLFEAGPNWHVKAVADGQLITGQNPQSSVAVAELVVKALSS